MPRSHPAGRHHSFDRADRVQWREQNAALISLLTGYEGSNDFLHDLTADLDYYGSLTEAQTAAALRWLNRTDSQVQAATNPAADATQDEAVNILNGDYTLSSQGMHLTYKIHTVQRGPLEGKRIIKIMQGGGVFKGFAFLTASGHVKVWRRFADDENRNERYIVWSHVLLRILREQATPTSVQGASNNHPLGGTADGEQWEVQIATRCRRCNRNLTNPSSIDFGLGPECAARESDRTTAAPQHATLDEVAARVRSMQTPVTFDVIAEASAQVDEADVILSMTPAQEPVSLSETAEQAATRRAQERMLEQRAADRALSEDDRIRLLGRLGHFPTGPSRERFNAIWQTISYWRRSRICMYCGRSDFESERGCTNHRNNYCPIWRTMIAEQDRERAQRRQAERDREQAVVQARGPNLSELGTVIAGSVWVQ